MKIGISYDLKASMPQVEISSSAAGQLEHPCEVKSSTTTGEGESDACSRAAEKRKRKIRGKVFRPSVNSLC